MGFRSGPPRHGGVGAARYGVAVRTLLNEAGRCRLDGGRADRLTETALAVAGGAAGSR